MRGAKGVGAKAGTCLRVVSYNVHIWKTADHENNEQEVTEELRRLDADVVCLQEVGARLGILKQVAHNLGMSFYLYGSTSECLGNAIMTRHPVEQHATRKLSAPYAGVIRNATWAHVRAPQGDLHVYVTHLDHRLEPVRTAQLKQALDFVNSTSRSAPHLILGDFNALRLEDYDEAQLKKLTEERAQNRWELPKGDVTRMMDEHGYIDCWRFMQQLRPPSDQCDLPPSDPVSSLPSTELSASDRLYPDRVPCKPLQSDMATRTRPEAPDGFHMASSCVIGRSQSDDDDVETCARRAAAVVRYRNALPNRLEKAYKGGIATCWAGTRIDYAWADGVSIENGDLEISRCVVDSTARGSDHSPIVLDVTFRPKPAGQTR